MADQTVEGRQEAGREAAQQAEALRVVGKRGLAPLKVGAQLLRLLSRHDVERKDEPVTGIVESDF